MEQRIVCAANKIGDVLLLGARHWDMRMHEMKGYVFGQLTDEQHEKEIQGFIDQRGNFLTRTEAWKVAEAAGQIIRRVGGDTRDGGTLYSENIY